MAITLGEYYTENFKMWVGHLSKKIGDREEAEDRVQNIFMYLSTRKEFCEKLLEQGNFHKYIKGAVMRQRANFFKDRDRRISTISYEDTNISAEITENQQSNGMMKKIELDDFYEEAIKLLADPRKSRLEKFNTVGEFQQYVFIQHVRNGKTFEEIGESIGVASRNFYRSQRVITILTPLLERYLGKGLGAI